MSLRLLRPQLGQLLVVGIAGDRLPVELVVLAREFGIGGLLLSPRNVVDALQVAELAREAATLVRDAPVWVGLHPDMPTRLLPGVPWPPLATLGRANDGALTTLYARALARERLALGLTLECAPLLDLSSRRGQPAQDLHTLGSDPALVARHGGCLVETLQATGLACCARHFPGIGEVTADSAFVWPVVDLPPDHFEAIEWTPFRTAVQAGVPAVMVSHVLVPGLDPHWPAAQSRAIVHDALRGRLGFRGVVFSDDLDALPAAATTEGAPVAVQVLAAGCDVVVQGGGNLDHVAATLEHIVKAAEREDLPHTRLEDALRRHEAMKAAFLSLAARRTRPAPPTLADVLASSEAERIADRMREFV